MSDRYGGRPIRSSLDRHIGTSATSPEVIEALVRQARQVGVIVFLKAELDEMPDIARHFIEGEHKRICEKQR